MYILFTSNLVFLFAENRSGQEKKNVCRSKILQSLFLFLYNQILV